MNNYTNVANGEHSLGGSNDLVKKLKDNKGVALAVGVLLVILLAAVATPSDVKASIVGQTPTFAGDSEERLIPFLPGLTKAAELAMRDNIYALDPEKVKKVSMVPYHVARDMCKSEQFQSFSPGPDRIMYEISVGNCGSTWQLLMIGNVVRMHKWRFPIIHIDKSVIENWPGVENVPEKESPAGSWGEGDMYGKLYKIQHMQPELFNRTSIIFNAFKLSEHLKDMNEFAKGACPCCFVMKDLLGDTDTETAMIYMHAFALGIDLTEDDMYMVRLKLAEWIKSHYCFPGSIHTAACDALKEFPELTDNDLPFNDYNDLEDE